MTLMDDSFMFRDIILLNSGINRFWITDCGQRGLCGVRVQVFVCEEYTGECEWKLVVYAV